MDAKSLKQVAVSGFFVCRDFSKHPYYPEVNFISGIL